MIKPLISYYFILLIAISVGCNRSLETNTAAAIPDGYQLVWSDEFNTPGIPDPQKWDYEKGIIRNRELQYYVESPKNARIEKGNLILETHREKIPNEAYEPDAKDWKKSAPHADYSSASLTTKGLADWQYGKIVVRAKLPEGRGLWPAIWMLGRNWKEAGWPQCGEIDIMEHVGFEPDSIFGTVHTKAFNHTIGTSVGKTIFINNPYEEYHDYAVIWTPEKITFYLDDRPFHEFENRHETTEEWPFDQPFHLKLNIAVGGAWGGVKGIDDSIFPKKMLIDYVRIYQRQ